MSTDGEPSNSTTSDDKHDGERRSNLGGNDSDDNENDE